VSQCECPILGTDAQGYASHTQKFEHDLNTLMLTLTFVINIEYHIKTKCMPEMLTLPS
jgi:hypothetical protein